MGDRLAGEESSGIWRHLHEAMSKLGLIDRKYKGPEDLARAVGEVMSAVPQRRVIVMFDEADNFLHDDSRGNYAQLTRLKALMEDTDRRFKLVFAGLQEVQRFKQLPNHPLAHLGEPILVGALEPGVARKLVRGPTDVLGYRMSNPVVLRVLSYTNYHPGLLQLFCSALVDRLQKRPVKTLPALRRDVGGRGDRLPKDLPRRSGSASTGPWSWTRVPGYRLVDDCRSAGTTGRILARLHAEADPRVGVFVGGRPS